MSSGARGTNRAEEELDTRIVSLKGSKEGTLFTTAPLPGPEVCTSCCQPQPMFTSPLDTWTCPTCLPKQTWCHVLSPWPSPVISLKQDVSPDQTAELLRCRGWVTGFTSNLSLVCWTGSSFQCLRAEGADIQGALESTQDATLKGQGMLVTALLQQPLAALGLFSAHEQTGTPNHTHAHTHDTYTNIVLFIWYMYIRIIIEVYLRKAACIISSISGLVQCTLESRNSVISGRFHDIEMCYPIR